MRGRRAILVGSAAALVVGGIVMAAPLGARAANTYTVITNLDTPSATCGTPAKTGSLRDCIAAANAAGGTNTITFSAAVAAPIVLTSGEIDITGSQTLTITGNGQSSTIIDGNAASRVFTVGSGTTVTMTDLTVRNGKFTNTSGFDGGGGIKDAGTLTLDRVTVSGNQALSDASHEATSGGILDVSPGVLTIRNSTISNNTASSPVDAAGGGLQDCCPVGDHLNISDSTFSGNTVTTTTGQAYGGAIANNNGTLSIIRSTFSDNSATQTDAGSGNGVGGSVLVSHAVVSIDGSTFHHNSTSSAAPGLGGSGAIESCCGSPVLTISNSGFDHNSVTGDDGAHAAAVAVCCGSSGSINSTTFDSNTVTGKNAQGGAVQIFSTAGKPVFPVVNSTFTGNAASGIAATGGALYVGAGRTPAPAVNLVNDTIDGNSATLTGANVFVARDGVVTALNTIISGTPAANCSIQAGGVLTDNGHNLDDASTSTCGFTAAKSDVLGKDPQLGALASNGGPTQTQALAAASPAVDAASNTGCPATDQRGITRVTSSDATCDIGAYELQKTATQVVPAGPLPPTGAGLALPLAAILVLWGVGALAVGRRRPTGRIDS